RSKEAPRTRMLAQQQPTYRGKNEYGSCFPLKSWPYVFVALDIEPAKRGFYGKEEANPDVVSVDEDRRPGLDTADCVVAVNCLLMQNRSSRYWITGVQGETFIY
ncbi:hypothetical protein MKW98_019944, partial [Papaver atlanticum]